MGKLTQFYQPRRRKLLLSSVSVEGRLAIACRTNQVLGGCRPFEVRDYLPDTLWRNDYRNAVMSYGIDLEVVDASKRGSD
jgi:hypothetical protein